MDTDEIRMIPEGFEPPEEEFATVSVAELEMLKSLIMERNADIIALVSVFQNITALFSGKMSALQMIPVITKLINDPKKLESFQHILPIIEKYTAKPQTDDKG